MSWVMKGNELSRDYEPTEFPVSRSELAHRLRQAARYIEAPTITGADRRRLDLHVRFILGDVKVALDDKRYGIITDKDL